MENTLIKKEVTISSNTVFQHTFQHNGFVNENITVEVEPNSYQADSVTISVTSDGVYDEVDEDTGKYGIRKGTFAYFCHDNIDLPEEIKELCNFWERGEYTNDHFFVSDGNVGTTFLKESTLAEKTVICIGEYFKKFHVEQDAIAVKTIKLVNNINRELINNIC